MCSLGSLKNTICSLFVKKLPQMCPGCLQILSTRKFLPSQIPTTPIFTALLCKVYNINFQNFFEIGEASNIENSKAKRGLPKEKGVYQRQIHKQKCSKTFFNWVKKCCFCSFFHKNLAVFKKNKPCSQYCMYNALESKYKITAFCKSTEKVHLLPVILEENTFSTEHVLYMLLVKHT